MHHRFFGREYLIFQDFGKRFFLWRLIGGKCRGRGRGDCIKNGRPWIHVHLDTTTRVGNFSFFFSCMPLYRISDIGQANLSSSDQRFQFISKSGTHSAAKAFINWSQKHEIHKHLYVKSWINNFVNYRCTVAQMAEWGTQDQNVPGSIPAWIKWDFTSKYTAHLFCIFVSDDHEVWYDRMNILRANCRWIICLSFMVILTFMYTVSSQSGIWSIKWRSANFNWMWVWCLYTPSHHSWIERGA